MKLLRFQAIFFGRWSLCRCTYTAFSPGPFGRAAHCAITVSLTLMWEEINWCGQNPAQTMSTNSTLLFFGGGGTLLYYVVQKIYYSLQQQKVKSHRVYDYYNGCHSCDTLCFCLRMLKGVVKLLYTYCMIYRLSLTVEWPGKIHGWSMTEWHNYFQSFSLLSVVKRKCKCLHWPLLESQYVYNYVVLIADY